MLRDTFKYIVFLSIIFGSANSEVFASWLSTSKVEQVEKTQVLTKGAVDDLVNRAAQLNELKTVLATGKKLPLPKKTIALQQNNGKSFPAPIETNTPEIPQNPQPTLARCHYQGQIYVIGDVVRTTRGWLRCSPTVIFLSESERSWQAGSPAWTALQ